MTARAKAVKSQSGSIEINGNGDRGILEDRWGSRVTLRFEGPSHRSIEKIGGSEREQGPNY